MIAKKMNKRCYRIWIYFNNFYVHYWGINSW